MSGVPDGRGGVLPPIKRQFPSNRLSPMTDENRVLGFATTPLDNAPPPLVAQRPSQVSPMRQSSGSFSFGYTPSRPLRQVSPSQANAHWLTGNGALRVCQPILVSQPDQVSLLPSGGEL